MPQHTKAKLEGATPTKKGAAREARRALFEHAGPFNLAFVCRGTGGKLDLVGRKLKPLTAPNIF